jgi:hypothetical protein
MHLPNGDTLDFDDGMSQDAMDDAVRQHLAAPGTDASTSGGGQPWVQWPMQPNVGTREAGMLTRGGIRFLGGIPDLGATLAQSGPGLLKGAADQVSAETGGNYSASDVVDAPKTVPPRWMPSEAAINATGLTAPKDQSTSEQVAESLIPFAIPSPNTLLRVNEAAGPINKVLTAARSEGGGLVDWLASNAAQEWAAQHGYDENQQSGLGLLGASARHALARTGGLFSGWFGGKGEEGGAAYDANRKIGVTPPLSSVAGPSLAGVEEAYGNIPFIGSPTKSAKAAQSDAIANRANRGLQTIAPGTTDITEAGPESLNTHAEDLGQQARTTVLGGLNDLKSRADAIEGPINATRVDATPILHAAEDTATDPNVSPRLREAAASALKDIQSSVDPVSGTIAWQALKQARTGLGATIDNMFPAQTGDRTMKRTVRTGISPIEDAMTASLADAADRAGAPQWRQLDADWTTHANKTHDLSGVSGTLERPGDTVESSRWSGGDSTNVVHGLEKAVKGDPPYLDAIDRGLGTDVTNRSIAETIAAKARMKSGTGSAEYRPDVLGARGSAEIGQGTKTRLNSDPVTAQGLQDIQDAIAAGKTTAEPRTARGLGEKLGSLSATLGTLAGGVFNPALTALAHLGASGMEDPSFVRSVAGRGITQDNAVPLLAHYAARAGQGAQPQPPDLVPKAWRGVSDEAARVPGLYQTIAPYLQMPR